MSVSLGTDPEFEFINPKEKISINAHEVLPRATDYAIGTDGASHTGEIRPEPTKDANQLTEKIRKLIKIIGKKYIINSRDWSDLVVRAGNGDFHPLGGHIHFGIKLTGEKFKNLLKKLDIASIFCSHFEQFDFNKRRRAYSSYGNLGNWRDQPWGFEYRVPGSFIMSPEICRGVLSLYHAIALDRNANPKIWKELQTIYKVREEYLDSAFRNADLRVSKDLIPRIITWIQTLKPYKSNWHNYRNNIDFLIYLVKNRRHWQETIDTLTQWGLREYSWEENLFNINYTDFGLKRLKIPHKKVKRPRESSISVFGLKKSRDIDISTNNLSLLLLIKQFLKRRGIKLKTTLKSFKNDYNNLEIGFHYEIRKKNLGLVEDILKWVSKNYKSITKKPLKIGKWKFPRQNPIWKPWNNFQIDERFKLLGKNRFNPDGTYNRYELDGEGNIIDISFSENGTITMIETDEN